MDKILAKEARQIVNEVTFSMEEKLKYIYENIRTLANNGKSTVVVLLNETEAKSIRAFIEILTADGYRVNYYENNYDRNAININW